MVEIIKEKCTGCGACENECFIHAIRVDDGTAKVSRMCMDCGHCYAVCPVKAVVTPGQPEDDVIEFSERKQVPHPDGDRFLEAVKSRRSIRNYKNIPVEKEKMAKVLEAGRFTPTGGNMQNVRYIFVQDQLDEVKEMTWNGLENFFGSETGRKFAETGLGGFLKEMLHEHRNDPAKDRLFFNAPALLLVVTDHMLNGGLAAANIEMMASAEGLGVLYSGFIQRGLTANPDACEKLGVKPQDIKACMLVGYPDVTYLRTAPRKPVKVEWM